MSERLPHEQTNYLLSFCCIECERGEFRTATSAIRFVHLGAQMKEQLLRTRQFLAHDREVLKFECMWDDPAVFGESRKYFRLLYYLSDNTVEVLEVRTYADPSVVKASNKYM